MNFETWEKENSDHINKIIQKTKENATNDLETTLRLFENIHLKHSDKDKIS